MSEISIPDPVVSPDVSLQNFQFKKSDQSSSENVKGLYFQAKLTVGAPDDALEHEADAMAERVTNIPHQTFLQEKSSGSDTIHLNRVITSDDDSFIRRTPSTTTPRSIPPISLAFISRPLYRPSGIITRQTFDDYVINTYGVTDVHTGIQTEQEARITRRGVPAPTIPTWQSWDPGTQSQDYTSIIDGIENMISAFGAIPQISNIIFFQVAYEPDSATGVGVAQPDTGASFGAGELAIYQAFDGSTNPATGRSTLTGTTVASADRQADISYIITHELGHGVGEAGAAQNHQMFIQFNATVGWIGNPPVLYDMGQPTVINAINNGTPLLAQDIITPQRWALPTVIEQPMSRYSVFGGPGEDFAESVAAYVNNPTVLLQRSPLRYNFLHTNIPLWISQMRPSTPGVFKPQIGDFPEQSQTEIYV